ncbi:hypothetical protein CJU90_5840 [Yarrowia sp. C11]|nr:hypothetical protein CJU90_5840 [Yarrowia sp. C11]KAG5364417.1 hypothetical protein CKK34_3218 [Yarrowia sp. E02]
MSRLTNTDFIAQLKSAFDGIASKEKKHSLYFTQKRLTPVRVVPEEPTQEYPLLIRVAYTTGGKKTKLTTEVDPSNLDEFWKQYTEVMKAGMALKKKDKKRKRK